ncbi:MAG: hypothetical protein NTX25_20340 [Proteobacteria bacterium]|nr:hypothetical protein [Pseudomonadota bacterium]
MTRMSSYDSSLCILFIIGHKFPEFRSHLAKHHLTTRNPKEDHPEHLNVVSARSRLQSEEAKLGWQSELGLAKGQSSSNSFTTLTAQSSASFRRNHSSDTLEAFWLRTHGFDSTQLVPEANLENLGAPFTSTRAAYRHNEELNSQDSLAAGIGASRNHDSSTSLDSRTLELSWTRALLRNWSHTLGLKQGMQESQIGTSRLETWSLEDRQILEINQEWSTQAVLGALQEQNQQQKKASLIMGASVSYTLHGPILDEKKDSKSAKQAIANLPELDSLDSIRNRSQMRAGWLRNLNQRRQGDAQFLADQFFAEGLWVIDLEQTLKLGLQRLQSIDKSNPSFAPLREDLVNLEYAWKHRLGGASSRLNGIFGLEIAQVTVRQAEQRSDRQSAMISYTLIF